MENFKQSIQGLSEQIFDEIKAIRRHLHQNPELSYEEYKTSEFIQSKLNEWGIPFKNGYVKTGIIGKIEGKNPSKKVIALRADIDALPVCEQNEVDYKSENHGVMHACGHDVHTASLLGTAKILNQLKDDFEGTVLLIFQPAEEKLPGGAKLMLEEGAFDELKPEIVIGQHVMPMLEAGKVGFKPGMYMASADEIYLTVKGQGGHAAMPHQLTDTVLIASQIIVALQQIVSRNAPADIPSVLSFGKVHAAGATNIIPPEVEIAGTFRTMNEEWRAEAHQLIKRVCEATAEGMGGLCEVDIHIGYPFLVNNEEITRKAQEFSASYLGAENVTDLNIRMTAEDFAYFSQEFPSTFYRLGIMDPEGNLVSPLHSPTFDVDEQALKTGMGNMAWLAVGFLHA